MAVTYSVEEFIEFVKKMVQRGIALAVRREVLL